MATQFKELGSNIDDRATLAHLNWKSRSSLVRYIGRRASNAMDTEDMVQEVLLRLLKRGGASRIANLKAYMFETASSVLKDQSRKERSHKTISHVSFNVDRHSATDFSAEEVLLGKEKLAIVRKILSELPERTCEVFLLRRIEGLRFQAIADRMSISVSAVEKHMQRATAHLTSRIGQD